MNVYEEVMKDYFPHTDICGVDGKKCIQNNLCKFWINGIEHVACWYVEFGDIVKSVFGYDDEHYITFEDEKNNPVEGIRHLNFRLQYDDKLDNQQIRLCAVIGFNSHRLADKIREKFGLDDWTVSSCNYEGGDDADLETIWHGNHTDKYEIKKKLLELRDDLMPKIIESEKAINTCDSCKTKNWMLIDYEGKAICSFCEHKIIIENIGKYVQ
jgi:hypothetical protein